MEKLLLKKLKALKTFIEDSEGKIEFSIEFNLSECESMSLETQGSLIICEVFAYDKLVLDLHLEGEDLVTINLEELVANCSKIYKKFWRQYKV